MSEAEAAARQITQTLTSLKRGSLVIWGVPFGRPHDNVHAAVSCSATPEVLRVVFDEGEVLEVWTPTETLFSEGAFRIGGATRVRWQWHSYGESKTPENLCFEEYVRVPQGVSVSGKSYRPVTDCHPIDSQPAVVLT